MKKRKNWLIIGIAILCFQLLSLEVLAEKENEEIKIKSLHIENSYIETPDRQMVSVLMEKDIGNITEMELICQDPSGNTFSWEYEYAVNNLYVFIKTFEKESTGIYKFVQLNYVKDGIETSVDLHEIGMDKQFGINMKTETSSVPTTINAPAYHAERAVSESKENIIIGIDAGHGGGPCAWNATYKALEKDLNLKIAKFLKAELEEYSGVEVFMTRETDTHVELDERVNLAAAADVDVLLSIHLNGWDGKTSGAEVYYPNNSLYPAIGQEGKKLAQLIQNELCKLGLYDRKIKVRDSKTERYSDGSIGDYYSIIRDSKLAGFPGLIIEHAFLDNNTEYLKFLSTDAKLRNLAVADAAGIAKHYGLTKEPSISLEDIDGFNGTAKIVAQALGKNAYIEVKNGEKIKTTTMASGRGSVNFNIADFGNARGTYTIEAFDSSGKKIYTTELYISQDTSCTVHIEEVKQEEEYALTAQFADMPSGIAKVEFAMWSEEKGQDDLVKYSAQYEENGMWTAIGEISRHKDAGRYFVSASAVLGNGSVKELGQNSFEISYPTLKVQTENCNQGQGTFDVVLSEVDALTGVKSVEVAVSWTNKKKDIRWYVAQLQEDGTYRAHVNLANHFYRAGTYCVDGYVVSGNGIKAIGGGTTQEMLSPTEVEIILPFSDCKTADWFYESLKYVCVEGIMSGVSETLFQPQGNLTRAQFAALLYRMNEEPEVEYKNVFQDVPEGTWYTDAVLWANENQIIYGYGNGLFGSNDKITREQMAAMMLRYGEFKGYDVQERVELIGFTDTSKVSSYAKEAMQWAVAEKIIVGVEKNKKVMLNPGGNATRAEGAAIIERFIKKYVE